MTRARERGGTARRSPRAARRRRTARRALLALLPAVAAAAYGVHLAPPGVRPVLPGAVYRSAQPGAAELRRWKERLGLAAVLCVRGEEPGSPWFEEERAAAAELGLPLLCVDLSGDRMPSPGTLAALVRHLDEAPRPLLVHCNWGVERAGLAAAVAALLDGAPPERAAAQLTFGDPLGRLLTRSDLPLVLDDYSSWLAAAGGLHAPDRFRAWVGRDYVPGFYRSECALVDAPAAWPVGRPQSITVRVANASPRPWRFRADRDRGVHLAASLRSLDAARPWSASVRAGLLDRALAPGEACELPVDLPALPFPGAFRLKLRLVDEGVAWFDEMGDAPLVVRLEATAAP